MTENPNLISGGNHTDERGTITFLNDFDMSQVKRFYTIQNRDISVVRAWRAHKIEQRWFYVDQGEFEIKLVKINDWIKPDPSTTLQTFKLSATSVQVLHIPAGYGSSIQATQENSKLIVFADYGLEHAKLDDYLYTSDYFSSQ
ncbi:dTDP-4-dehydrorhamnose 3,5-epimerase-like enzyme [Pedobacter sp. UYP30]|uniref:WxcM-like domain-containing protein n=1 Tax=Pedobacter sp. UYP30 TaxID=1756400 RepID=UPI00339854B7